MEPSSPAVAFAQLGLSPCVSDDSLRGLAEMAEVREYPAGSVIFREGSRSHNLYLIECGEVALDIHVLGRGPQRILSLGPGEFLAWSAVIGDTRMTATATAVRETTALAIPADKLHELCEKDGHFGYHFMRAMATALSTRLTVTRLQLLDLFTPNSRSNPPPVSK